MNWINRNVAPIALVLVVAGLWIALVSLTSCTSKTGAEASGRPPEYRIECVQVAAHWERCLLPDAVCFRYSPREDYEHFACIERRVR
jgi:hypothetical protein